MWLVGHVGRCGPGLLMANLALRGVVATALAGVLMQCHAAPGDVYVANGGGTISRFSGTTGALLMTFGSLGQGAGICFGPDGKLYASSANGNRIQRFDPDTGASLGNFISSSTLSRPFSIIFGLDGNLYVSANASNVVRKYNGTTGAFLGVAATGGGLSSPIGLAFDGLGNLLVASSANNKVLKYNPANGAFLGEFAANIGFASDVRVRHGVAFVSSASTGRIRRYSVATGADLGDFGALPTSAGAFGMDFGLDGSLLVGAVAENRLYRISAGGGSGTVFASSGLATPENMVVQVPAPGLSTFVLAFGAAAARRRRGAT